jgi:hypothetical protein
MRLETTFEILISYKAQHIPSQIEEGHGYHELGNYTEIEVTKVEIVTEKDSIDITRYLPASVLNEITNSIETDI